MIFQNSPHDLISLSELVEEVDKRNDINAPVWSITGNKGLVEAEKRWEERVASENTTDYKLVFPHHFAYDPVRVSQRSFNLNYSDKIGCVSQSYTVFKIIDEQKLSLNIFLVCFNPNNLSNKPKIIVVEKLDDLA